MLLPHLLWLLQQLLLYLHLLQKLLQLLQQLLLCHDKKRSLYSNVLRLQQLRFKKKNFVYTCKRCGQKFDVLLIDSMCSYLHLPHLLLQQLLSQQFLEQLQQLFLQLQKQLQQLLQLLLPLQLQYCSSYSSNCCCIYYLIPRDVSIQSIWGQR